ncbi:PspC domain-containing protein [Microbacterium sp. NPDC058342]|uniref:PspC domain-containing protein n=1 Tax=Microbacterium sp. NPDC058342 TaxID=3346454 RepID=UPI00365E482B
MTFPTAPPSTESDRAEPPRRSDRFFAWVAGLGVARSDGWIGGVAAGLASRLRIDPLIVRGVLVVAAVCGLPLVLIYALAWALLPDPEGRIHLRELMRGRFEPAQLGILAGAVVGLFTLTPSAGILLLERVLNPPAYVYGDGYGMNGFGVFLFVVGLVLVGILLILIVRAARRTPGDSATGPRTASAAPAPPHPSAQTGDSGAVGAETRGEDAATTASSSLVPDTPADPSDAVALDAWRAQHAEWQEQERGWRRQQQDADRAARERARGERQAAAAAFAAEAAERRRVRRAANPRASFAFVAATTGVALITAAAVWLLSADPTLATAGTALFAAALVVAFGMVIAGVARRRSGFLAFVTVATLVAGLITGGAAALGDVRFGQVGLSNADGGAIRQPFGNTGIILMNMPAARSHPVVVHKGDGYTEIFVNDGVELELTATVRDATVEWNRMEYGPEGESTTSTGTFAGSPQADGSTVYRETVSSPVDPDHPEAPKDVTVVPVTIDQQSGRIVVVHSARIDEGTSE